MGVKKRAVVAQRIPTASLFLEDFQTSHFQATEAEVREEEGRRDHRIGGDRLMVGDTGWNAAAVLITDRGIDFLNI